VQLRAVAEVPFEGVFDADRDALCLLVEATRIDAASALLQQAPDTSRKEAPELSLRKRGERANRLDAGGDEALFGLWSDAREPSDVERREEARLVALGNDGEPPGFRWSLPIFATTFDVETPIAQVRLVAALTEVCTASATLRASRKVAAPRPTSR
jgi:hypothetical protein